MGDGEVTSGQLRSQTLALLDRVQAGERVTITAKGQPVAVLAPAGRRPQWIARGEFAQQILVHQADPAMADDLAVLVQETIDDLPLQ